MIEVSCVLARILINAVYKLILSYCNNIGALCRCHQFDIDTKRSKETK